MTSELFKIRKQNAILDIQKQILELQKITLDETQPWDKRFMVHGAIGSLIADAKAIAAATEEILKSKDCETITINTNNA